MTFTGNLSMILSNMVKHNKEEPVIIGPGGIFYITDHHHLARALYEIGVSTTYSSAKCQTPT